MEDKPLTYDEIIERGWTDFDNQSECEDFMYYLIDKIKKLEKLIEVYKDERR